MTRQSIIRSFLATVFISFTANLFANPLDNASGTKPSPAAALFIENKGQITGQDGKPRNDIDFKMNATGINVFVGDGQLHYQWEHNKTPAKAGSPDNTLFDPKAVQKQEVDIYRLDVVLVGANPNAVFTSEERQGYTESYYLEQCPQGITAGSFRKITYKDIYPGIDWVLYMTPTAPGAKGGLKYDFIVHPGADPSVIKLRYEGASSLGFENGSVKVSTPFGNIVENKPYTYEQAGNKAINSAFVLNDNVLSFDVAQSNNTLVIDPYLDWGSYFGSTLSEWGAAIAVDKIGDLYFGGYTLSTSNLATFGSHQFSYGGWTQDGFVAKFKKDGPLQWATYYGGNGFDQVNAMAVDASSNVYFTGTTTSMNGTSIATSGSHQSTHGGSAAGYGAYDIFVAKLNPNGQRQWGTYYGDSLEDIGYAIACDKDGYIYVGGSTGSRRFIATTGAFKTTYSGGFLVKFSAGGVRQWGTYFGDTGHTYISSIACDIKGNIYCTGSTSSYTNIATTGSHQPANGGGTSGVVDVEDGFLVKFSNSGQRVWSTYYGGEDFDNVLAVACDERGSVYIGGETKSTLNNSIATTGAYKTTLTTGVCTGGLPDGFIAKFNEDGVRQWGTYYGTNMRDKITSIVTLPNGKIYASGWRYHPCPPGPPPPYYPPASYIVKFNGNGTLAWLKDSITDYAYSQIAYGDGKLGFVSSTPDTARDTTRGFFKSLAGAFDAYVQHYTVDTAVFITLPFADTNLCYGQTMHIPYDVTNRFNSGNTWKVQLSNLSGSFTSATTIVNATADSGGTLSYIIPNSLTAGKGYRIRIIGSNPVDTSFDNYVDIRVSDYPKAGPVAIFPICANGDLQLIDTTTNNPVDTKYIWTGPGGFTIDQKQYIRPNVQITDSGYYVLTVDNYGCKAKDSVHVDILPKPAKPTFTSNSPLCTGDTLKLSAKSAGVTLYSLGLFQGGNLVWFKQGIPGDTMIAPSTLADTGSYIALAIKNGCPSDPETTKVVISPYVIPTVQIAANPGATIGPWVPISFSVTGSSNTGSNPTYQWVKNGVDIPGATGTTYSTSTQSDLQTGDTICLRMTSNEKCAVPATVKSCLGFTIDLGVGSAFHADNGFRLYPNPTAGDFAVEVSIGGVLYVNNIQGQTVSEYRIQKGKSNLSLPQYLTPGIYMGKFVANGVVTSVQRIVLNK